MRKYEIMYILKADLDEAARKAEMDKLAELLTSNGATVDKVDESFGLRELAYPINDELFHWQTQNFITKFCCEFAHSKSLTSNNQRRWHC